jgi:hypothetical protein
MSQDPDVNPASEQSVNVYRPTPVVRDDHSESSLTRLIEQQTAKLPSDLFLFAALGAMTLSLFMELSGRHQSSRFFGMWAPALLTMGVYNKVVKLLRPQ